MPDFCQLIFITTPNKLKEDKGKIKKFLKVIKKAIQFINTHLEEAVDVYAKYTQTDVSNQLNKTQSLQLPNVLLMIYL